MGPTRLNEQLTSHDAHIEDQVTDTIQSGFNWFSHRSVITDIRNNRTIRVSHEFHDWVLEIKK